MIANIVLQNVFFLGAAKPATGSEEWVHICKNIAAESERLLVYKRVATTKRIMMLTRRLFALSGLTALLACASHTTAGAAPQPAAGDPTAFITEIYTRVAKGKGDGGGSFVVENKTARAKYLSKPLTELWAKADAATPKGDVGPIDWDPVTNSQDPDVKSFRLATDKLDADKATIAVTLTGHRAENVNPADQVIRYDLVHEGSVWKIDDIKSAVDGKPWSVRALLTEYLKDIKSSKK